MRRIGDEKEGEIDTTFSIELKVNFYIASISPVVQTGYQCTGEGCADKAAAIGNRLYIDKV